MRAAHRFAARYGMGALFLVVLPLLMVAAAIVGSYVDALVPAVALAVLLGLLGTWLVSAIVAGEARALAARIDASDREPSAAGIFEGRQEWRELADAIDRVVDSLHARSHELAGERVRSTQLLEELPSAVLLFDDAQIVYSNQAAQRMFGDALGAGDGAGDGLLAEPSSKALLDAVEEARAVGRTIDVEIERGDAILAARASVVAATEVVLVVRDVTRARRLAAVRRDFVVNASHELKTPVAGIQALAESLSLALAHDPARAVRMVSRIEREAGRLARLVRDLLDLARLEEPDTPQDRRRVDLVSVVMGQLDRLQSTAAQQGVTVTADLPERSVIVATPEDVRSIVANLIENAIRYNRPGGRVAVSVTCADAGVELVVSDTGEGIPPQDRERIFERFYRIDKARSRSAGGTGLGLSLVRHATQRLGGTISLDSELGVGSTFRVELPVAADER
ncbi:MAG: PAS domain-containing protein [Actinobacteria bacterium]|nr:PAS domain-containing protein [Actinomycetota bacterium]